MTENGLAPHTLIGPDFQGSVVASIVEIAPISKDIGIIQ